MTLLTQLSSPIFLFSEIMKYLGLQTKESSLLHKWVPRGLPIDSTFFINITSLLGTATKLAAIHAWMRLFMDINVFQFWKDSVMRHVTNEWNYQWVGLA